MAEHIGHQHILRRDGSTTDSWYAFTCGHCGRDGSALVIAKSQGDTKSLWIQCPTCAKGSVVVNTRVFPDVPFGPKLAGLPDAVDAAYEEARDCMAVAAYTAAEGICRKILMHVAVDKRAAPKLTFAKYISYLESEGFITPPMKNWVDLIRKHGNEANHELEPPDRERAESTVMFTAQLLRSVYEMDHLAKQYQRTPAVTA